MLPSPARNYSDAGVREKCLDCAGKKRSSFNPLKISRFTKTCNIFQSGEFEWDCINGMGKIKRDGY